MKKILIIVAQVIVILFGLLSVSAFSGIDNSCEVEVIEDMLLIRADNIPLLYLLSEVKRKTGIEFRISNNESDTMISLECGPERVEKILRRILMRHNYSVVYSPKGKPELVVVSGISESFISLGDHSGGVKDLFSTGDYPLQEDKSIKVSNSSGEIPAVDIKICQSFDEMPAEGLVVQRSSRQIIPTGMKIYQFPVELSGESMEVYKPTGEKPIAGMEIYKSPQRMSTEGMTVYEYSGEGSAEGMEIYKSPAKKLQGNGDS